MIDIHNALTFLRKLSSNLYDIEMANKMCWQNKHHEDAFVKVLASSILEILVEAKDYFSYYEENIAKCFAGISLKDEVQRVHEAVFSQFQEKLTSFPTEVEDNESMLSQIICAVAEFIDKWNSLDKDTVDQILASAKNT